MTSSPVSQPPAIVLIFHGSRRPAARQEAQALAERLAARVNAPAVAVAFLENTSPSIAEALAALAAAGHRSIRAIPLFSLTGRHIEEDVPAAVAAFRQDHPTVAIVLETHLAASPWFVDALAGCLARDPSL